MSGSICVVNWYMLAIHLKLLCACYINYIDRCAVNKILPSGYAAHHLVSLVPSHGSWIWQHDNWSWTMMSVTKICTRIPVTIHCDWILPGPLKLVWRMWDSPVTHKWPIWNLLPVLYFNICLICPNATPYKSTGCNVEMVNMHRKVEVKQTG